MKKECCLSVITPSFNMLPYLPCAAASVADQNLAEVEHLVIDGASTDGTVTWLAQQPFEHLVYRSEPDHGMYDAINKGFMLAPGKILSYLNCDEQYLEGTLSFVMAYFEDHPDVDILFGDVLLIRPDGSLIAFRKGYAPRWRYILSSHLYLLSCTMFFRREIIDRGFLFDTRYKAAGDADFVVRLLRQGFKARHVKRYFSAFTMTGNNLSVAPHALAEQQQLLTNAPLCVRVAKPMLNLARWTEKFLSGAYFQGGPIEYAVYPYPISTKEHGEEPITHTPPQHRHSFSVRKASFRWQF